MVGFGNAASSILDGKQSTWLVTGVAGFIGSNLLEYLLSRNQKVIGVDNFVTGSTRNLEAVRNRVGEHAWEGFKFLEADIRQFASCVRACEAVDFVLHHAALGSVPGSLADPLSTTEVNVGGFVNMLTASQQGNVKAFVYASSSAVYGDATNLPHRESDIGRPLSPYAASKVANEVFAEAFANAYGLRSVGLRYFNVYGPRQNPNGPYAAVVSKWVGAIAGYEEVSVYGDGTTTRDFCYVTDVVAANVLAAQNVTQYPHRVFNIAKGAATSLNELFSVVREEFVKLGIDYRRNPIYGEFRAGDIPHSVADISRAKSELGFAPSVDLARGVSELVSGYAAKPK